MGFNAWIGSIAFFVAREKGFFKDEGLDVQAKSFSAPGDGLTPLLTGDLDAVLSTADSVLTVLDKAPGQLKVVYLTDTSAGRRRDPGQEGHHRHQGDEGARRSPPRWASATSCCSRRRWRRPGLTDKDIQLVNMNPDDAGAAFAAGKIDVAVTWEPWITKVSGEKKGHVIFSSKETPNLILDVLAISAKTAKNKAGGDARVPQGAEPRLRVRADATGRGGGAGGQSAGAEARRGQGHAAQGDALQPGRRTSR